MPKFNSIWDYEMLFNKTKLYAQRAFEVERESEMFPFWSALTLEYLGRATLAKVHPVLLADPRDGDNILYVFGYSKSTSTPKSITAKTLFDRCTKIVPNFTKKELDNCLALIERRNEELHSGTAPFSEFPTKLWLSDYYKVCKILLNSLGLELIDLFGEKEAVAANEMILDANKELVIEVKRKIKLLKNKFSKLSDKTKKSKIKDATNQSEIISRGSASKIEKCVCCNASGIITGKVVSVSEAKLVDGEIIQERIILPTNFICLSCNLTLNSHQELNIAGYGGQFSDKDYWDPAEYHGIETYSPEDYYDYGNE